ncbi:hypothetical protein [Methylobacter sp. YRD-M1]|uniref:hypothetical protein n=1 Tax=Methylobacter sp. YRD-M1 TaxID=2911520 RepID=UPI00227D0122|nr:hypothetical protein [Methylobacter sp. YRD-M1]WAK03611.1 hypothetical protein LZ558_07480 [Methylobacter sp. YRD-M1]
MKKLILIAPLVAAAGWWYFVEGRTLTEDNVLAFYKQQEAATLSRHPEELCAQMDDEFQAIGDVAFQDQERRDRINKEQACQSVRDMYKSFDDLGDKMGGTLQLDYGYSIHKIDISPDRKSAVVDVSYSLDVAGSIMHIRSRGTDTLIRRNGKMLVLRSEEKATLESGFN